MFKVCLLKVSPQSKHNTVGLLRVTVGSQIGVGFEAKLMKHWYCDGGCLPF